jgi:hypothetical protein
LPEQEDAKIRDFLALIALAMVIQFNSVTKAGVVMGRSRFSAARCMTVGLRVGRK